MAEGSNENIQATLRFSEKEVATGHVANITNRGFVVVCEVLKSADNAPGRRVTLQLSGAELDGILEAPGHIQGVRSEDSSHHRVVVWVDDIDDLNRLMESGVSATFNRRAAYRVDPSSEEPVAVTLVTPQGDWSHDDHACNVSATGLALLVNTTTAGQLEEGQGLTISVTLPRSPMTMDFAGHVRRLIPKEDGVLVGLDFDPDFTDHYDRFANRIIDYIMRRQREILREEKTR